MKISRSNLLKESVPSEKVFVTGNTVIDALLWVVKKIENEDSLQSELSARFKFHDLDSKLILVTDNRREFFGGFERICQALANIEKIPGMSDRLCGSSEYQCAGA